MQLPTPEERAAALLEVIGQAIAVGYHEKAQTALKATIVSMIETAISDSQSD